MTEVLSSIRRVTNIMSEIRGASVEQSAGVTQIGEAVGQMADTAIRRSEKGAGEGEGALGSFMVFDCGRGVSGVRRRLVRGRTSPARRTRDAHRQAVSRWWKGARRS